MIRRKRGQASVEEHPKGSGKYRVRSKANGKIQTVAAGLAHGEALEVADAWQTVRSAEDLRQGVTLTQFGLGFLARRKASGVRGIRSDSSYWRAHVERDPIGALPIASIERRDLVDWLDRRVHLAFRTRVKLANLLRVALDEAVDREVISANPAANVKPHKSGAARATDDLDGILNPAEQIALLAAVPEQFRPTVTFALCTGLRQAEQWHLQWIDVAADRVVVRRSTGGLPPKSGKPREVFLLPPARAALAASASTDRHVFATLHGAQNQEGKAPRGWKSWLRAAGIERRVRWHDLRHTCATSLLAGWWGRKWSLDEVCRLLGHSSVTVTERYARKLNETQQIAVSETPMLEFPSGSQGVDIMALSSVIPANSSAFVKHRSSVQIRQSAPSESSGIHAVPVVTDGQAAGEVGELTGNSESLVCKIPLKGGLFAFVDREDFERVSVHRWRVKRKKSGALYVVRDAPDGTTVWLHREIMGGEPGTPVDHRNGNGLDNRQRNLRLATHRQNASNVTSSKNAKRGGFKGVTWNKRAAKWEAGIAGGEPRPNGKRKRVYLGVFERAEDAARAYDEAAVIAFGEFASLNFPPQGSAETRTVATDGSLETSRGEATERERLAGLRAAGFLGARAPLGAAQSPGRRAGMSYAAAAWALAFAAHSVGVLA